jgi:hexosaminidase
MIDGRLWPRAAVVAERLWSPEDRIDPSGLYPRLFAFERALEVMGSPHRFNSLRMLRRIPGGDDPAVEQFIALVEPVKNLAHWKTMRSFFQKAVPQQFNSLADVALPESMTTKAFDIQTQALLGASQVDAQSIADLSGTLQKWQQILPGFTKAAEQDQRIKEALPIAENLDRLCEVGLNALESIANNRPMAPSARADAETVLRRNEKWMAASATKLAPLLQQQPPADLILPITPSIRSLVDRADRISAQP